MNKKYGKLVDGELQFAPSYLRTENGLTINPTKESYLSQGWKLIVEDVPQTEANEALRFEGYIEEETEIHMKYVATQSSTFPSAAPRRFSKLKMLLELKRLDMWVLTRTWLQELGLYDFYLAANEFSEDNEWFQEGKRELQRLSGKTDKEIEAILAASVID